MSAIMPTVEPEQATSYPLVKFGDLRDEFARLGAVSDVEYDTVGAWCAA